MNITVFDIYLEIYYDFERFKKQIIHFFPLPELIEMKLENLFIPKFFFFFLSQREFVLICLILFTPECDKYSS